MPAAPAGLHHVTAIATEPQVNADFYHAVLSLRLVKTRVNFDDPGIYHLYYGNCSGQPGTLVTFFSWPRAARGRRGAGRATTVAVPIPEGAIGWWRAHLDRLAADVGVLLTRGDGEVQSLSDADGLALEYVSHHREDPPPPWEDGPIPAEHAIRGLHKVTLTEVGYLQSAGLLTGTLGFRLASESASGFLFAADAGAIVDVSCSPEAPPGLVFAGTVHHIAWRSLGDAEQVAWRDTLPGKGLNVTPVIDRQYFYSISFREPGGALLEIANDPPGSAIGEPLMQLGRSLKLPPWLEPTGDQIEHALPTLKVPGPGEEIIMPGPPHAATT